MFPRKKLQLSLYVCLSAALTLGSSFLLAEGEETALKLADGFMQVHKELLVVDGTITLASMSHNPEHIRWFKDGGVTVASMSVSGPPRDPKMTTDVITWFSEQIQTNNDYMLVRNTDDILRAKRENKLGIFYHFQSPVPFQENVDRVWYYKALGVGLVQLAYNKRSPYANGATERIDGGLSDLGVDLVKALNEARIIVDVAHTGEKSALDMIEISSEPVVLSHGNAFSVVDNPRNVSDKLLKAISKNGGVAGVAAYPAFISKNSKPKIGDMLKMIDHMVDIMGIDHVALGLDYDATMHGVMPEKDIKETYDFYISSGTWDAKAYPPPPYYYPEGIERPDQLHNLTGALLAHGYSKGEVAKLMGLNWFRIMKQVWDDPDAKEVQGDQSSFVEH